MSTPTAPWSAPVPPVLPVPAHHTRRTRRSGPRSHRPGHTSRRWGCSGRWRRRTGWGSRSGLARRDRWSVSGPCFVRRRWGTTPRFLQGPGAKPKCTHMRDPKPQAAAKVGAGPCETPKPQAVAQHGLSRNSLRTRQGPHLSRWSWTRPRCSRSRCPRRRASGWGCSGCSCT